MAMAELLTERNERAPLLLGGYTALAESTWMGAAQASDVLEPARTASPRRPAPFSLRSLFQRELSVTEASAVLMASFFCSALLGAVRQVLFNIQFGAGTDAIAYYAAFRLPDTLFSLIAGGALSSAMIPVLLATVREEGDAAGQRLISLVLSALLAVFAAVVVAGELAAPAFVGKILAPGFDPLTSRLTVALTRLMLIQPIILAAGSVATAVLNGRNRFALTALSVASHNVGLIAGIMASRLVPGLGIYGPALGVIAGAVLQALILLPALFERNRRYRPLWDPADRRLRAVVALLIPNGLAVGVGYAGNIVDTAFASKAVETAGLAALQNAWMLVGLPIALLGQAVGQAAFPRLAASAAALDWMSLRRAVLQSLGVTMALAVPALLALLVLGRPVIRLLFEHGKFGAATGDLTFAVLVPYALALPAYVASEVLVRSLIALQDTRTPLFTNSAQLATRAGLMALLLGTLDIRAIPTAFALAAVAESLALATVLFVKVQRRLHEPAPAVG